MKKDGRRSNTKIRIMENAIRLFSENGLDAVSIRHIAGKTGISAASFYNHFKSTDELLVTMYDYYKKKIIEPVENSFDPEAMMEELGAVKFLEAFIELMFQTEHDEELFMLSRIIAMEQYKNRTAAEIAYMSRKKSREMLTGLLITMEKKGLIQPSDPGTMATFMGYMLIGLSADYYHQRYIQNIAPDTLMNEQKELTTLFCKTLLNPTTHQSGKEKKV
jgi:AcrR family transcriptional regulator